MSKSDPLTNKEIVVVTLIFAIGALVFIGGFIWSAGATVQEVLRFLLGLVLAMIVLFVGFWWLTRQDARRIERRHLREYHSEDPKP